MIQFKKQQAKTYDINKYNKLKIESPNAAKLLYRKGSTGGLVAVKLPNIRTVKKYTQSKYQEIINTQFNSKQEQLQAMREFRDEMADTINLILADMMRKNETSQWEGTIRTSFNLKLDEFIGKYDFDTSRGSMSQLKQDIRKMTDFLNWDYVGHSGLNKQIKDWNSKFGVKLNKREWEQVWREFEDRKAEGIGSQGSPEVLIEVIYDIVSDQKERIANLTVKGTSIQDTIDDDWAGIISGGNN